jgi:3-dehydroquinate synthase
MKFKINSSISNYQVLISKTKVLKMVDDKEAVFIIDRKVASLYKNLFPDTPRKILINATEKNKDLTQIPQIFSKLKKLSFNKEQKIICVGGGILQDLATFIASVYMRGVDWEYYPTTLLSMVDSCLGGKSSINLSPYKNLIGNFHPPSKISVLPQFIDTLSSEDKISGLLEALKILYANKKNIPSMYLKPDSTVSLKDNKYYYKIITDSLLTKKQFIEEDEFDQGIRKLLNFGHTFGHALESISSYKITHGVAVGYGMLAAINYVKITQTIDDRDRSFYRLIHFLLSQSSSRNNRLIQKLFTCKNLFFKSFDADKKHSKDSYRLIVPKENSLEIISVAKSSATKNLIWKSMTESLNLNEI